ncbi:MAG: bifunctional hydroxymethylpyrimidine kinase/phosphomethylpyrimidine kinase [Tannerellaceae bacterium]|jgi:hydroxymethylpyrimidine/phosphomethylpyrimidine kinase|nr:bifunctional hydroxymethylpyrimidine kinase/phosphomethylpyrimidine kinase [Tannerellaceae bacterium]
MTQRYTTALTVAGSDSGGCAGIQADLKTFSALGVFGASVITSITAQNTCGVRAVETLSPDIVRLQLEAVFDDLAIDAIKTGMLPSPAIVETLAEIITRYRPPAVIIDPVMVATSGDVLTPPATAEAFRSCLYPLLTLLTPNLSEAALLAGIPIRNRDDVSRAAEKILAQGCRAVLVKGGHFSGGSAVDTLFQTHTSPRSFSAPRTVTHNLHGTGCTLSAAIAAGMAAGLSLEAAIVQAKSYISSAIFHGAPLTTGKGNGPVNHFFSPRPLLARPSHGAE